MALSDAEVSKQIKHMMAFIEQEANEKVEEIDAKAEEEFNIEKGRLVQQQRLKVMEYYDKKEKQVELERKIQSSNMLNQARIKVLKSQDQHISEGLEDARKKMSKITENTKEYQRILTKLITQGLCQLLESQVFLRCRAQDVDLVKNCVEKAVKEAKELTSINFNCSVDSSDCLPKNSLGGVELYTKGERIKIGNTLDARLELIAQQIQPQIRDSLFGKSSIRKFNQ